MIEMSSLYRIDYQSDGSGLYVQDVAGQTLGKHKLVYRGAAGTWLLADANSITTMIVYGITLEVIPIGLNGRILLMGYLADVTWSWAVGGETGLIYASGVAGELTQTAPALPTDEVQGVAVALSATAILFSPPGMMVATAGGLGAHAATHEPTGVDEIHDIDINNSGVLLTAHKSRHVAAGADPFVAGDLLDATARVMTRLNGGADVGPRRRINFIPGAGIAFTVADDAGNEEVDVTVANNGAASLPFYNFGTTTVANAGTIAHGCTGTPTRVRIMANGTVPIEFAFTVDATNITVYHTSGGSPTVFWEAEV